MIYARILVEIGLKRHFGSMLKVIGSSMMSAKYCIFGLLNSHLLNL
jgi:hypothetical protein